MRPKKYPLRKDRIRHPPKDGWSWIDRGFVRDKVSLLDRDAILLYFFLAAVSDKHGLSYWSDAGIVEILHLTAASVCHARQELEFQDLIAYRKPLYQVLSLQPAPIRQHSEPSLLGDIFREIVKRRPTDQAGPEEEGQR